MGDRGGSVQDETAHDKQHLASDNASGTAGDAGRQVGNVEGGHHGYISSKEEYLRRLRRIEGQALGLQKMVEEEKYCIDILTQVSAMTSALQSVALGLLDDHLDHCVRGAVASGEDADAKLKEASAAIARLVRS
jgi:CsoR family transcriptional regulator, copper-sensing transcriptional repressor